jgi:hypothetical protein
MMVCILICCPSLNNLKQGNSTVTWTSHIHSEFFLPNDNITINGDSKITYVSTKCVLLALGIFEFIIYHLYTKIWYLPTLIFGNYILIVFESYLAPGRWQIWVLWWKGCSRCLWLWFRTWSSKRSCDLDYK